MDLLVGSFAASELLEAVVVVGSPGMQVVDIAAAVVEGRVSAD